MSKRPPISVTIISLNEEACIAQAIRSVAWAEEVVVVDSGSTDRTVELARSLGARVLHNPWAGYGQQKNFAQRAASHDWVLNLDADELVPPSLASAIQSELAAISAGKSDARGFEMPRRTFYLGQWIRHGGWYPNHLVRLADRRAAAWTEPAVHEALTVQGPVRRLREPLDHYAFHSIGDQIVTNLRFSTLGTEDLRRRGQGASLLLLIAKPLGKLFETYFIKRGCLDGIRGLIISVNAAHSIFLKYANLFFDENPPGAKEPANANPDRR